MKTLIVGASGELGAAVAEHLANAGHEVILHGHKNIAALQNVGDKTGARTLVAADVTSEAAVADLIATATQDGKLDGLVYAAGINTTATAIAEMSLDSWNHTLAVNLTGAFLCTRAALPFLRLSERGAIVLISSIFGLNSPANRGAYGVSKHGLSGLVQSTSKEEAPRVRVNAVCPGPMWTENVRRIFAYHAKSVGISVEEYVKQRRAQIPMGRFLDPRECASVITYLLSEEARFITGETIRISGGEA